MAENEYTKKNRKHIGVAEICGYKDKNGFDTGFIKKPGSNHIPIVACFRTGKQLVFVCPFCGREHYHGACGPNFGDGDGHRVEHCLTNTSANHNGYYLRESKEPASAGYKLMKVNFRGE